MECPICGFDTESEQCTCTDEEINERLILDFKKKVYEMGMERERRKRKEFFDKIKRFFGIKTSDSNETDAL